MLVTTTVTEVTYADLMKECGFSEKCAKQVIKIIEDHDRVASYEWSSGSTDTEFYPFDVKKEYIEFEDVHKAISQIFLSKNMPKDKTFEEYKKIVEEKTHSKIYLCDDGKTVIARMWGGINASQLREEE